MRKTWWVMLLVAGVLLVFVPEIVPTLQPWLTLPPE